MARIGSWSMDLKISMNGKDVRFWDLNKNSREQLIKLIADGYSNGQLFETEKQDAYPLNCIVYKIENAFGEMEKTSVRFDDYDTLDTVLTTASQMYAFSDLDGREVELIRFHGEEYEYDGWAPGMTYSYTKKGEKKPIWCGCFPHWDH